MKRLCLSLALPLVCWALGAQQTGGSLSGFMQEELTDFQQFLTKENQEFISFLREPWKQADSEKPVEQRRKPEPKQPVRYDANDRPPTAGPVCLPIEEILDLTTQEGKQQPTVQITDVEDILFDDAPVAILKPDKKPVVVIRETTPQEEPAPKVVVPAEMPQPEAEKKRPVVIVKERPEEPALPQTPQRETPREQPPPPPPAPRPQEKAGAPTLSLTFAGESFAVSASLREVFRLRALEENSIADAYELLCRADSRPLLQQLSQIRTSRSLNDWGYFQLIRQASGVLAAGSNERTLLQLFLLNESGYRAKIARKSDEAKLLLFIAPDSKLYGRPYIQVNGQTYYYIDGTEPCRFYMCQKDFSRATRPVGMALQKAPLFAGKSVTRPHRTPGSTISVSAPVPESLMAFYQSYPQCDYGVYFHAPVNPQVREALFAALQPAIRGKSEAEAANILISFVQTAFDYKTDPDQFGYEKPFFIEELFYYPYSDCEDRAMLYSYLVRELLGLEVVLLDYPQHIATAVAFKGEVAGDYVVVSGRRYTVCDPTYIGAPIGQAMPQFRNVKAKIIQQ
ncbi:MAG: hypothetical protein LBM06_06535 [Prevotellaceae bacterium]|jgi:hypothetical protein|nr:hypothetical protein [Prevotellaceae bacterium]